MKTFHLEVITPDRSVFAGTVTSLVVPAYGGLMGILPGHAPLMTPLETGVVKIGKEGGKEEFLFLSRGFLEVENNRVLILADVGEGAKDIDLERAAKAEERARTRLKARSDAEFDLARAEAALQRAIARQKLIRELRRK